MKYAIVIPDGLPDEPQEALAGKTPLQAARIPNMDKVAQMGIVGRSNNVPASLTPASDVATLSLFGYDPLVVYTGRAPLESAAMGIALGPNDWAIRCNLVTVEDEEMRDFTAGHISNEAGQALIASVQQALGGPKLEFHAGVSYRNLLVYRGKDKAPFSADTRTQPPHDIPDELIAEYLPRGPGSELLRDLMQRSRDVFRDHPANKARQEAGQRPATQVWLWGQGRAPQLAVLCRCLWQARGYYQCGRPGPRRGCTARLEAHRCADCDRLPGYRLRGQGASICGGVGISRSGVRPRRSS